MSGNLDPTTSPSVAPSFSGGRGVRRLNRIPMMIVFGICVVIILAVIYTFHQRVDNEEAREGAGATTTPQAGSASSALANAPKAGLIPPAPPPAAPAVPSAPQQQQNRQLNPIEQAQLQAWTDYEQRKEAIDTAHYQAEVTAIGAPANINGQGGAGVQMAQASTPALAAPQVAPATDTGIGSPQMAQAGATPAGAGGEGFIPSYSGLFGGGTIIPPANPSANDQTGKKDFLGQQGSTGSDDYLASRIQTPQSPYEVQAGTVIPATMIGGIDSDLPGQIIGQVRENVYDTPTGKYLLIPQGSRLVGVYSSAVTYGQTRVLIAWNRIIYPNGNSIDLGQMPGSDVGGYAGFNDEVNDHFVRIFGSAIMASLFSAGAQLSQPQNSNGNVNSTQILAASIGQQANTVGAMLISRGLDIQPTLTVRNGYRFNIMVTRDMVLQPWPGMQPLPYGTHGRN
jgi:type IV secretory pathway VirB10-like protein